VVICMCVCVGGEGGGRTFPHWIEPGLCAIHVVDCRIFATELGITFHNYMEGIVHDYRSLTICLHYKGSVISCTIRFYQTPLLDQT
jgi:hypothetical protein